MCREQPKFPCPVCKKNVNINHRAICCDICNEWVHIKCNRLSEKDYKNLQNDPNKDGTVFHCIKCVSTILPFNSLTNLDFYSIVQRGVLLPIEVMENDQLSFLKCHEYINNLNEYVSSTQKENDEFSSPPIDCKYYTINEFIKTKFNPQKTTSIFHINIHSIEKHIDELRTYLLLGGFHFDILAISESKLQTNVQPKIDITINGYHHPLSSPTKATKGGVLLYIKENLLFKPRPDLTKSMTEAKKLESNFVEIINPKSKNDVVGVIYRHPTSNPVDFTESYLKPLLEDKLSKDILNKNVYLAGDFNFDLTNISHQDTSDFFDTMTSNQMLPTITLPTKLNNKHDTLHDNIFTNQFSPDMVSGKYTVLKSDHLASFLITPNKNKQFLPKKHNITKRDTKNFNQDNFLHDINEIKWEEVLQIKRNDVNYTFNSFYDKLEGILNLHLPNKKYQTLNSNRSTNPG
jgi:exonuclease III